MGSDGFAGADLTCAMLWKQVLRGDSRLVQRVRVSGRESFHFAIWAGIFPRGENDSAQIFG